MCMQAPQPLDEYNIQLLDNVMPASWIEPQTSGRLGPFPASASACLVQHCSRPGTMGSSQMVQVGNVSPQPTRMLSPMLPGFR